MLPGRQRYFNETFSRTTQNLVAWEPVRRRDSPNGRIQLPNLQKPVSLAMRPNQKFARGARQTRHRSRPHTSRVHLLRPAWKRFRKCRGGTYPSSRIFRARMEPRKSHTWDRSTGKRRCRAWQEAVSCYKTANRYFGDDDRDCGHDHHRQRRPSLTGDTGTQTIVHARGERPAAATLRIAQSRQGN